MQTNTDANTPLGRLGDSFVKDDQVRNYASPYNYNILNDSTSGDDDEDEGMDLLQQHQDFPQLLAMAQQIQVLQHQVLSRTGRAWISQQKLPNYSLTAHETVNATVNLQVYFGQLLGTNRTVVCRGDYPITDSLLDDSFKILKKELRDITVFAENPYEQQAVQPPVRSSGKKKSTRKRPRSSNCVGAILSKEEVLPFTGNGNHMSNCNTCYSSPFPLDMMDDDFLDSDALLLEFADQWLGDKTEDDKASEYGLLQPLKRVCYEEEGIDHDILDFGEEDMETWASRQGLTW